MGFAVDDGGATETLYMANSSSVLSAINETTLDVTASFTIVPAIGLSELTGSPDGRLFAISSEGTDSQISQLDRGTGAATTIGTVDAELIDGWAFSYWGGDFYVFGGDLAEVTRYRPSDGASTVVATYPDEILGTGISVCAPP